MTKRSKQNILTAGLLLATASLFAQDAAVTTPAPPPAPESNLIMYLLITACAVLLMAVLLLGNVWVNMARAVMNKGKSNKPDPQAPSRSMDNKNPSTGSAVKIASMLLLLFSSSFLFAAEPTATEKPFQLPIRFDILIGLIVLSLEFIVVLWMLIGIKKLTNELSDEPKKATTFTFSLPHIFDNINASVAIEKEKDILLDHNYDGIRELDNALPPWWKYSFYISIVWAIFYLGYYYIGGGPSSKDEYQAEIQQAKLDVEDYNKKNALNVDENNVQLADAAGILDGQDIFKTNCAACHGNNAEGNVGPNLTDAYWLHGGSVNEVFKSVKYGWAAKGMKSWQTDLSAVQIKNVISYIHGLQGSNPANAKAPQGDLYSEGAAKIDSTVTAATDTTKK